MFKNAPKARGRSRDDDSELQRNLRMVRIVRREQRLAREAADEVERTGVPRWTPFAALHVDIMRRVDQQTTVVSDYDHPLPWVVVCKDHGETARSDEWGEILRRQYAHLRVWHGRTS